MLVLKTVLVQLDHLDKSYNPLDLKLYGQLLVVAVQVRLILVLVILFRQLSMDMKQMFLHLLLMIRRDIQSNQSALVM